MKNLSKKEITCEVIGGAYIYDCVKEALQLSMEQGVPVKFEFSSQVLTVDFAKFVETAQREGVPAE